MSCDVITVYFCLGAFYVLRERIFDFINNSCGAKLSDFYVRNSLKTQSFRLASLKLNESAEF